LFGNEGGNCQHYKDCPHQFVIADTFHPSGNLNPSHPDTKLTKEMVAARKFPHIAVLDHVIIRSETYYSFPDEGLL
jgi:DNA repair protein RadC